MCKKNSVIIVCALHQLRGLGLEPARTEVPVHNNFIIVFSDISDIMLRNYLYRLSCAFRSLLKLTNLPFPTHLFFSCNQASCTFSSSKSCIIDSLLFLIADSLSNVSKCLKL